jgi:hypothetical protein
MVEKALQNLAKWRHGMALALASGFPKFWRAPRKPLTIDSRERLSYSLLITITRKHSGPDNRENAGLPGSFLLN